MIQTETAMSKKHDKNFVTKWNNNINHKHCYTKIGSVWYSVSSVCSFKNCYRIKEKYLKYIKRVWSAGNIMTADRTWRLHLISLQSLRVFSQLLLRLSVTSSSATFSLWHPLSFSDTRVSFLAAPNRNRVRILAKSCPDNQSFGSNDSDTSPETTNETQVQSLSLFIYNSLCLLFQSMVEDVQVLVFTARNE